MFQKIPNSAVTADYKYPFLKCVWASTIMSVIWIPQVTADSGIEAERWYRESYAPLWEKSPADNIDLILDHYAETITTHLANDEVRSDTKDDWLRAPMAEWIAQGWLAAELIELETQEINATTASFKAAWKDLYINEETEISCGWYLADKQSGRWLITQYAESSCD